MKKLLLLTLLYFTANYTFAQDARSDLYLKVVEVMKDELGYTYVPDSNRRAEIKQDSAATNSMKHIGKHSTPIDWPPLIILDGKPLNLNDLNKYKLDEIETIKAKKEKSLDALYGTSAKNGVIFITTQKGSKKKSQTQTNY
jgi:hypothetical protein